MDRRKVGESGAGEARSQFKPVGKAADARYFFNFIATESSTALPSRRGTSPENRKWLHKTLPKPQGLMCKGNWTPGTEDNLGLGKHHRIPLSHQAFYLPGDKEVHHTGLTNMG